MNQKPLIQVDHFSYSYEKNKRWVLNNLNFSIEKGQIITILGANDSGKTSLLRALNGLVPHSFGGHLKGDIFIKGKNTKKMEPYLISNLIGTLFQRPETQLFCHTVEEELAFSLECRGISQKRMERKVQNFIELFDLQEIKQNSPLQLSGGQKQRVALASTLITEPPILLLDEPFSSLDPQSSRDFLSIIQQLNKKKTTTVLFFNKEVEKEALISDKIISLNKGQIGFNDRPSQVLNKIDGLIEQGISPLWISEFCHREKKIPEGSIHPQTIAEALECLKID